MPADPSDFYLLNEALAAEVARLDAAGHLDRLRDLVEQADVELLVASVRRRQGLEELLGVLRPGPRRAPAPGDEAPPAHDHDHEHDEDGGCGCGPLDPAHVESLRRDVLDPGGGWDSDGVLAARSRFTVDYADGTSREVYMPDHVCPTCWHDADNCIDGCERVCGRCGFRW